HYHVCVPANPEYSSLNLAMAVQLLSYEVRMAYLALQQSSQSSTLQEEYPRHQELERFYAHLEQVIMQTEFISAQQPGQVMNKLRRMFTRARPEAQEINILRGILTSVQKSISRKE
ncbi:tRNA (cytosine(32)/uridine(32)-2'-O)-methyltransferase TrmJ, partial [Vibrio parahaemolyticus]|nr:tRNA (cytosine(32)/uridine(32)-2'-O)-methyltransferase TrmJ [Vibrio parahaemolyticus]